MNAPHKTGWLALLMLIGLVAGPAAQPDQLDDEFAKLVKEWTTKPEFMSPLVDHLPKKAGVPTPKDLLGYHIGEPKRLTYWAEQQTFYRALEQSLPQRLKTSVIGKTEEGREIMVVYVSSEANLANLEQNRQNLKRLADPRGLDRTAIDALLTTTKPVYNLSGGLHSGETNPPEMLMELAYRLAVSEEPYIRQIRDNVIISIIPTTDIDGRDRYLDWYFAYKIDEPYEGGENFGGPPYWGKYVFHDNNRDINYGVDTLRAYLNWYLQWVPPIWHDLHEQQTLLYTFSGQPPNSLNLDPILYTELPFFATYEVNKLTGYGMPGVWHFGFVDTWSPGYLAFSASNHNGMIRMYEIFNQGGANTKKARLQGPMTQRQWYRPNPAAEGEVDWSIRNSINYAETGVLTALELTSTFPQMVVENFYRKTMNSIEAGSTKPPHAFVIPAGQRDRSQVDRVANLLRRQAIEVHRANSEIKTNEGTIPGGSYIVKLNQPYGRFAKTLLEKQNYPDPQLQTYDDSAWTMGLASNIEIKAIDEKSILDAPMQLLTADVQTPPSISGSGSVFAIKHTGALNLITLRYRLKDIAVKASREPFKAAQQEFPAGSFLIETSGAQTAGVRKEIESLGLGATLLPSMPQTSTMDVDLPRIAVYTTWSNTEKVGWLRLAFDRWEIPFGLIHKDHVQAGANLRAKYDVIVLPHQGNSGKTIVYEQPKLSRPLAYKKHDRFKSLGMYAETDDVRGGMGIEGVAEFARFLDQGGVLLTLGVASYFPAEFGLARLVDSQRPSGNWYAPGPYVQTEVLKPEHPVMFGYSGKTLPVRWAEGPLLQIAGQGGPSGASDTTPRPDAPQVIVRFTGGDAGVLSGLMRGADQLRNRPAIVDAPVGKGRVILYVNNPIYRWQTFGEHALLFNALLFYNDLPASGPAARTSTAAPAH